MKPARRLRPAVIIPLVLLAVATWAFRDPLRNSLALLLAGTVTPASVTAASPVQGAFNNFDVSDAIIPTTEIFSGGPPRDGIPSIDHPVFVQAADVTFLHDDDLVVSVSIADKTRAYPLRILVWHEIVNDVMADLPFAVTYCPLCGTAMVFDRTVGNRTITLGVSGLLYHSDVLMYDRETESLWSQLKRQAISGEMAKTYLPWRPSEHLTWAAWKEKYPTSQVLSTNTGHERDYSATPYQGYEDDPGTIFPVPTHRDELPTKEWVLGIVIGAESKAYRLSSIPTGKVISDMVGGSDIEVSYDPATQQALVMNINRNEEMPYVKAYWFAWQAFHPETGLWLGD